MGILKATVKAVDGAASDQWKEAFICEEMGNDTLMKQGRRMTSQYSSNEGSHNVITEGSVIIVGEGECAIVTDNGKVTGIFDEPGEQIFRSEESRGIFTGGMRAFAKDVGRRISYGGEAPYHQCVYYINTKELSGGEFHSDSIPFRCKDPQTELDMDGRIRCAGSYSFHITDPERFYKAVIRSQASKTSGEMVNQMNSELLTELQSAAAVLSEIGIRLSELPEYTDELCSKLRHGVNERWRSLRGIEVFSMAIGSLEFLDHKTVQTIQRDAVFSGYGALLSKQDTWKCRWCGYENSSKFCENCGKPKNMFL